MHNVDQPLSEYADCLYAYCLQEPLGEYLSGFALLVTLIWLILLVVTVMLEFHKQVQCNQGLSPKMDTFRFENSPHAAILQARRLSACYPQRNRHRRWHNRLQHSKLSTIVVSSNTIRRLGHETCEDGTAD
jgi:hypothetical protein